MIIELDRTPAERPWVPPGALADGSGEDDVFHVRFDPADESVVQTVVRSVSTIRNVDPLELEPLGSVIEPATLEGLVDPGHADTLRGAEVSFEYEGMNVTVDSDGNLWLEWR